MGREIKPDFGYLLAKIYISDPENLRKTVLKKCRQLNMEAMAKDVESFLFDASDVKKVVQFEETVKQYTF
ncbi:MAG: hypothetical protein R6V27_10865 [Balneolaceae bacterium]